jgi:hypothetical protein
VHAACGGVLDDEGGCPRCGGPVAPADLEIHPGPGLRTGERDDRVTRALGAPHRLLEPLLP